MKIALVQLNYHVGNFELNTSKIINAVNKAKAEKCSLIIFPELAVSGYPPRDFLEFADFIERCNKSVSQIADISQNIAVILGVPSRNLSGKGKPLYNSAIFIKDGEIISMHHKSLLPNYDVFDEYRYFEPDYDSRIIELNNFKIALTICEDLWNIGEELLYPFSPMEKLSEQNPDLIVNIAASPFNYNQADIRKDVLRRNVEKYKIPLLYVNHVGAQTELIFDGGSMAFNKNAEIINECKYFEEDYCIIDSNNLYQKSVSKKIVHTEKILLMHNALVLGIKDYFSKLNFKKAILGLSGGIDSAIVMVLAVRALGNKNVKALLLPSMYSTQHSVDDAVMLANNLKVDYEILSIENSFNSFIDALKPSFNGLQPDVTEENLQARIRAVLLMAFSNKFGYVLLNTSNKSEAAVGYGTLYGDMCGGLSVIGDLYKTQVYELAHFINKNTEIIPENIILKPPSAELKPGQKDTDSLPEYNVLDDILYQYIENRTGPKELAEMGFEKSLVDKVLKLVNTNEYKRHQTPPILRVSEKAFGMGRRMPIAGKYLS